MSSTARANRMNNSIENRQLDLLQLGSSLFTFRRGGGKHGQTSRAAAICCFWSAADGAERVDLNKRRSIMGRAE